MYILSSGTSHRLNVSMVCPLIYTLGNITHTYLPAFAAIIAMYVMMIVFPAPQGATISTLRLPELKLLFTLLNNSC